MIPQHRGLALCLFILSISVYCVQSVGTDLLSNLSSTLIPPYLARDLVEVLPRNSDVIVYIHNRYKDGSYIFGYILSTGERRYERATRHAKQLYVDGFYSHREFLNSRYVYKTTWYTAGRKGYYPKKVEVTYNPPKIPTVYREQE